MSQLTYLQLVTVCKRHSLSLHPSSLTCFSIGTEPTSFEQQQVTTRSSKKRKLEETQLPSYQRPPNNKRYRDNEGEMLLEHPTKVNEETVGEMIGFLEQMRFSKQPAKKEKQPKLKKQPPIFKNINLEMQSFIVFLRYESLIAPGPPFRSFGEIGVITKLHQSAVANVCKRWIANGCRFINGNKKPKKYRWFTPEIESFLTKQQTLMDWASLSLQQRVILIEQRFGVSITI